MHTLWKPVFNTSILQSSVKFQYDSRMTDINIMPRESVEKMSLFKTAVLSEDRLVVSNTVDLERHKTVGVRYGTTGVNSIP